MHLDTDPALYAWAPINGASISVIADPSPLSNALPNSLQVTIPPGLSGQVGFSNEGFWGKVDSTRVYRQNSPLSLQALMSTPPGPTMPLSTTDSLMYRVFLVTSLSRFSPLLARSMQKLLSLWLVPPPHGRRQWCLSRLPQVLLQQPTSSQ